MEQGTRSEREKERKKEPLTVMGRRVEAVCGKKLKQKPKQYKSVLTLETVAVGAGAGGWGRVLGSHHGGEGALLLDGRHHVGGGEGEDAGGAAAVGGQAGGGGHGGAGRDD